MKKQIKRSLERSYNLIAKPYNEEDYSKHSLPTLKKYLKLLPKQPSILDIGCGGGPDSKFFVQHECEVMGIDISKEMIKIAREKVKKGKFFVTDFLSHDFVSKKFDGIWCNRVFQHIPIEDQSDFIKKASNLLNYKGVIYISTRRTDAKRSREAWSTQSFAEYEGIVGKKVDVLVKNITSKAFKTLFRKNKFEILEFNLWKGVSWMEIIAQKK